MREALTEEQINFYKKTMEHTRKQIKEIDAMIEEELKRVREKLAELQNTKKSIRQIYDAACVLLGVENEFEKEGGAQES
ncbi:MAG: hypothetical protein ACUVUG_06650 [Candidatus Aminicenantia bacterium]